MVGLAGLCSGLILPVAFFPPGLREFLEVLPFASTLNLPVEVYLGKLQGEALVGFVAVARQCRRSVFLCGNWQRETCCLP